MPKADEDYCERCGELKHGKRKLMFYRWEGRFPQSPVARQFFCYRCLRIMRIYAAIGFCLLAVLVGSLVIVTLWARQLYPDA